MKRFFDLILATIFIIVLSVAMLFIIFVIRLTSKGSALYWSERVGLDKLLPGLTGWARVNGRDELSATEKVMLEVEYMQKKSFWFDLKILWLTFLEVIQGKHVSH